MEMLVKLNISKCNIYVVLLDIKKNDNIKMDDLYTYKTHLYHNIFINYNKSRNFPEILYPDLST